MYEDLLVVRRPRLEPSIFNEDTLPSYEANPIVVLVT